MSTPVFWISLTLAIQILLINQEEVGCIHPVNNYRSKTGVFFRHDLQQLKPFSDLYGVVVVPELSNDDDATAAAVAVSYNQPSFKRFSDITRKRFPIFVGRRSDDSDEEIENWNNLYEEKRGGSHLFVGRRAPPIFVGKKTAIIDLEDLESNRRKKRSTNDQTSLTDPSHALVSAHLPDHISDSSQMTSLVKQTPSTESNGSIKETENNQLSINQEESLKRSRLFVGKREEKDDLSEDDKRSRMFVGKRKEEKEQDGKDFEEKRSRMFVGKREENREQEGKDSEEKRSRMFVGKREEEQEQEGKYSEEKRSRMFVGKRPADPLSDDGDNILSGRRLGDNLELNENDFNERDSREDAENDYMHLMTVPEKKSRMFVGKRTTDESDDDWNEWNKRSPKFVGKRSPKFVGKRAHKFVGKRFEADDMSKRSRIFVGKRQDETDSEEEEEEEADSYNDVDSEKRSRMFVGRRRSNSLETINKITPKFYFGKRLEDNDSNRAGADKRNRMFVGKKSDADSYSQDDKRSPKFVGKRPFFSGYNALNNLEDDELDTDYGAEEIKRSRMFVGKRPAPGFVGKRPAPGFVGKRPAPGFVGKRPAPGFVGKRPAPGFVGKRPAPGFVGK